MSKGVNLVIAIGNVGKIEKRGSALAISLAVNEKWFDKKANEQRERVEWMSLKAFGKLADICEKYVRKGDPIYIEGKLQTSKYQGQDGSDRYSTDVVLKDVQFLGAKSKDDPAKHASGNRNQANPTYGQPSNNATGQHPSDNANGADDFDDDIPF